MLGRQALGTNWALVTVWGLIAAWVLVTLSLAGWWIVFSIGQLERLVVAGIDPQSELVRYQKMLLWEGAFLVLLVLSGAIVMGWAMWRQAAESARLKTFFATFSHELKTPLSSVMLQAEILAEQLGQANSEQRPPSTTPAKNFIADLSRLNLQLENAIEFSKTDEPGLFIEQITLADIVNQLAPMFPAVEIKLAPESEQRLRSDRRALEIIFRNLIANSEKHGKATQVKICLTRANAGTATLTVADNGSGLPTNSNTSGIGTNFTRLYPGSGSGIGLVIVNRLVTALAGRLVVRNSEHGRRGALVQLELAKL